MIICASGFFYKVFCSSDIVKHFHHVIFYDSGIYSSSRRCNTSLTTRCIQGSRSESLQACYKNRYVLFLVYFSTNYTLPREVRRKPLFPCVQLLNQYHHCFFKVLILLPWLHLFVQIFFFHVLLIYSTILPLEAKIFTFHSQFLQDRNLKQVTT